MKIVIFYHAFLENYWRDIFQSHLETILDSGLYDNLMEIRATAIWKQEADLQDFKKIIEPYKKIKLYERYFFENPPFGMHRTYYKKGNLFCKKEEGGQLFEVQLGEGETVVKALKYAKEHSENIKYLLLHTKGCSSQFISKEANAEYDEQANNEMTERVKHQLTQINTFISNWKCAVEELNTCSWVSPFISINLWWASSELLKKFNMQKYLKWHYDTNPRGRLCRESGESPDGRISKNYLWDEEGRQVGDCYYAPRERHAFALFPLKLEKSLNDTKDVGV